MEAIASSWKAPITSAASTASPMAPTTVGLRFIMSTWPRSR
jgi:hypothetical protein